MLPTPPEVNFILVFLFFFFLLIPLTIIGGRMEAEERIGLQPASKRFSTGSSSQLCPDRPRDFNQFHTN